MDAVNKAGAILEMEDNLEKWEVTDISHLIPKEYKSLIDAEVLEEASDKIHGRYKNRPKSLNQIVNKFEHRTNDFGEDQRRITAEHSEFFDKLTGGRFFDPLNFNHFVAGQDDVKHEELRNGPFNRHSQIIPTPFGKKRSGTTYGELWISSHGNGYASKLSKPLAIFSPYNPQVREWLRENVHSTSYDDYRGPLLQRFLSARELPKPEGAGIELFFKSAYEGKIKRGTGAKWTDVADCIVDLKAGKMWTRKYSEEERNSVSADIADYSSYKKRIEVNR